MAAMSRNRDTLTFGAAVVTAGLAAGLFFFNASTVMPALADVDDRTFVEVMDKINDAVYNPVFFAVLLGDLGDGPRALTELEARATTGKLALRPDHRLWFTGSAPQLIEFETRQACRWARQGYG